MLNLIERNIFSLIGYNKEKKSAQILEYFANHSVWSNKPSHIIKLKNDA